MKKLLFLGVVTVSVVLAACQVNNVRDTGGGAVSPWGQFGDRKFLYVKHII